MDILKFSNAGGFTTKTRYADMLAGNTVWNPYTVVGSYDSLSAITIPSGGVSTITFSNIPSTYTHLQLRMMVRTTASQSTDFPYARFNSDSGANYSWHTLTGNGSAASSGAATGDTYCILERCTGASATANMFGAIIVDILDYANTNKYKVTRSLGGVDTNGGGQVNLQSNMWLNTAAISSITIGSSTSVGLAEFSSFALYGVKA